MRTVEKYKSEIMMILWIPFTPEFLGTLSGPQTPFRKATSARWRRVVTLHQTLKQI
jgi:hypothetical protein